MSQTAKLTNPPAKILLNQKTSMSLNDRFSQIAKIHRPASTTTTTTASTGAIGTINNNSFKSRLNNNLFQKRASMKNRRLALQMANRPSVQAALKIKKKSIKQRLGFANNNNNMNNNNKSFLTPGAVNNGRGRGGKNILRQRVGRGGAIIRRTNIQSRLSGFNRVAGVGRGRGRPNNNLKTRLGNMMNKSANDSNTSFTRRRNALSAPIGTRVYTRGGGVRGRGRGGRLNNRRRGGSGVGVGGRQPQQPKSKESLDTDLDQYMSKSKSHLDTQLDQYMSQTTH